MLSTITIKFGQILVYNIICSCSSKDIQKMHSVLFTNTHHDVTDFVNYRMVKNTKTYILRTGRNFSTK